MKTILVTGSSQSEHIATLLSNNGYKTRTLNVKKPGRYTSILWYYIKYAMIMITGRIDFVYWVYVLPQKSIGIMLTGLFRKKMVLHWIGTDVYNFMQKKGDVRSYKGKVHHLAGSKLLHDELKQKGINSDIIPIIPFSMRLELQDVAKTHAALIYLPQGKEEFYGARYIRQLAIRNSTLQFHIVANSGYEPLDLPNVIFHGKLSADKMNELYREITILIRLPEHDGLSMMMIEALAKGKQVLYKYQHPYVYTPRFMEIDEIDGKLKEILKKEPILNIKGHEYVLATYNEIKMMELYKKYHVFD